MATSKSENGDLDFNIFSISNGVADADSVLKNTDSGKATLSFLKKIIQEIESKVQNKYGDTLTFQLAEVRWQNEGDSFYGYVSDKTGVYKYQGLGLGQINCKSLDFI
ncbi:MAG: hypothetical protein JNL11_15855 [Bdellovibrionaceae bacterium]|nr:hypothetical protein [Pseudobdellovibrionaceae bacterium]